MSYDPGSPVTLVDDLPRAVAYGQWATKFSNAHPPEGLSEGGAWGHVARWLAQKGGADFTLRSAGVTQPNLLTQALLVEPTKRLGWPSGWAAFVGPSNPLGDNARGGQRTLRGMLLWGVNQSPDQLPEMWTSNPTQLVQAIGTTIQQDPDPAVRREALKLISTASFPVERWLPLIDAIRGASAILGETPFSQADRLGIASWLRTAEQRLTSLAADQSLPLGPGGYHYAPPRSVVNWKLWGGIAAGAVAATAIGVVVYRRHRARALPA